MDELKVKYWAGWMDPKNFDIPGYWKRKARLAIEAQQKNMEIHTFRIPLDKIGRADPDAIREIEELLQKKYKDHGRSYVSYYSYAHSKFNVKF